MGQNYQPAGEHSGTFSSEKARDVSGSRWPPKWYEKGIECMLTMLCICSRQLFAKTLDTISGGMLCLQIAALPPNGHKSTIAPLNNTFISLTQSNVSETFCECL